MKRIVTLLMAMVMLVACFGAFAEEEKFDITFVTPLVAHPVWDVARAGFEAAAAEFGFNSKYVGPQGIDPAEMVNQIEIALADQVDAILTMPIAPEAMRYAFKECADQGVPVVFTGAEDLESTCLGFVGTNEAALGAAGAAAIMEKMAGQPIKAHIMMSTMDASFAMKARDGYLAAFENYEGEFEMVLNEACNSDTQIALDKYTNALLAHPEINVLIGVCSEAGGAAAKACKELGRDDILIMAIDDIEETLDYVRKGEIWATMAQNFYKIGYEGGKIAYEYLANGTVPPYNTDSGSMCVTMDNIDVYMESLMS